MIVKWEEMHLGSQYYKNSNFEPTTSHIQSNGFNTQLTHEQEYWFLEVDSNGFVHFLYNSIYKEHY